MAPSGKLDETYALFCDSGPFAPLCENMRSSTKLEVDNELYCRQKRTELRPQVACTENLLKFGRVVSETCKPTDKQTHRHADLNISPINKNKVKINH